MPTTKHKARNQRQPLTSDVEKKLGQFEEVAKKLTKGKTSDPEGQIRRLQTARQTSDQAWHDLNLYDGKNTTKLAERFVAACDQVIAAANALWGAGLNAKDSVPLVIVWREAAEALRTGGHDAKREMLVRYLGIEAAAERS